MKRGRHLLAKLSRRSPDLYAALAAVSAPKPHPLFYEIEGPVESWEKSSRNND